MIDLNSNTKREIKKYLISRISEITYIDKERINGESFLYRSLCMDIIDAMSLLIDIENKFYVHVDDNIDLQYDMSLDQLCDEIMKNSKIEM